jgi:hypothetical protein
MRRDWPVGEIGGQNNLADGLATSFGPFSQAARG